MIIFSVMILSSWIFAFLSSNECFNFLNFELQEGESQFNPLFLPLTPPPFPHPLPIPGQREKSKRFMETFKAFIKLFEASQSGCENKNLS